MPDHHEPKQVSRFEANLLRILHLFLRRDPTQQAFPLIFNKTEAPPCLSRTAVELIKDTLAKGCISILARTSGWWTERHLRQGKICEGRLWQRHPPHELTLSFSENTLQFLLWITSEDPVSKKAGSLKAVAAELTLADVLFLYFAYDALRKADAGGPLRRRRIFTTNALCRLAFPEDFADPPVNHVPDFSVWTEGLGAAILEALQDELRQRWVELEKSKGRISDWERMQAVGQSQRSVLAAFLDAMQMAERRDLARFLFPVVAALLPDNPKVGWWTGGLRGTGTRLADRTATMQAALELVRQMSTLHEWQSEARLVGFFDENYAACQLYKNDWEHWQGDVLYARAGQLLEQIQPLR